MFNRIKKNYVSEADILLTKLRKQHEPSVSQIREIEKHAKIFAKRDDEKK